MKRKKIDDAPAGVQRVYEYKLYPTPAQEQLLWGVLRATRELYCECLEERRAVYKADGEGLNYFSQKKRLKGVTLPGGRYEMLDRAQLEATCERLHNAYKAWFNYLKNPGSRKIGPPDKPKPREWDSFKTYRPIAHRRKNIVDLGPRIGCIRFKEYRPVPEHFGYVTVIRRPEAGEWGKIKSGWFVQFSCEVAPEQHRPTGLAVGIDLGVGVLAQDSDGLKWQHPGLTQEIEGEVALTQASIKQAKRGSNRRRRLRARVTLLHEKQEQRRKLLCHELSRYYVDHYDRIAVEDLGARQILDAIDADETMPAQAKRAMRKKLLDGAWAKIRSNLKYKAEGAGVGYTEQVSRYTTSLCSRCGYLTGTTAKDSLHKCPACAYEIMRRLNSARNILQLSEMGTLPDDPQELSKAYREWLLSQVRRAAA